MGWRKRVQRIAETNPEKLHPIIRQASGTDLGGKCWDRASWQEPSAAGGRPIHLILRWLGSRSLLTSSGEQELAKAERGEYGELFLAPSLVSVNAAEFLNHFYQEWYDTTGINFGIDANLPFNDQQLDDLWQRFNAT